jgi:peptidoglycan/LPS O-acetylase OafA/YrhL
MPELDSIRGLAILAVLFYHGFYWSTNPNSFKLVERTWISATWTGRMGVNLFFVLSGFLITGILIDSRDRPRYYKQFYVRRALRILPAYYGILVLLLVTRFAPWPFVALSSVYLANLTPLFGIGVSYPVLWSLAVEEHFYLLWPLVVRNFSLANLATCSVSIIIVTPLCRVASFYFDLHRGITSYVCNDYTWNASDGLACGALAAILLRYLSVERRQVLRVAMLAFAGAALLWVSCLPFGIWTRQKAVGAALQNSAWNIAFVGFLLLSLLLGTSRLKYLVVNRYLSFFGYISYGLYLIHVLMFSAYDGLVKRFFPFLAEASDFEKLCLRFLIASAASVALAYMSRRWFENPFLRRKAENTAA